MFKLIRMFCVTLFAGCFATYSHADKLEHHNGVDKVYHPYVQPLEREIEFRSLYQTDSDPDEDGIFRQRLGVGAAISEHVFVEGYLIGKRPPGRGFRIDEFEIESRIQLTEQGEFAADWGLLFEVAKDRSESLIEVASVLLVEKEFGSWVGTLNLGLEYEFGSDIQNEFDVGAAAQFRYRYSEALEPAIEMYKDEFTFASGPVLQGLQRFGLNRKLHWEAGVLFPLNNTTPDTTVRLLLEFEF